MTVDPPAGPGAPLLRPGNGVVLLYTPGAVPGGRDYVVTDRQRTTPLVWLLALADRPVPGPGDHAQRGRHGRPGRLGPDHDGAGVLVADLSASEAAGAAWSAGR
jgi:hypothetical protein